MKNVVADDDNDRGDNEGINDDAMVYQNSR